MKRRSKVSLNAATGSSDSEQNFWPSYADMMSSIALILFFIMLLTYLTNLKTSDDLNITSGLLSQTQSELDISNAAKENAESKLAEMNRILDDVKKMLDDANVELEGKKLILVDQQQTIDAQAIYLSQAQSELEKAYGQMENIVGIRRRILEQIKQNIDAVMGDSSKVSIGENGNIILNEGVFFDSGKSDLKPESVVILNRLIDVFYTFLSNPDNAKYIESIIIAGHTDSDGTEENNQILSTSRANAVLAYLLSSDALKPYSQYFCAAGYGETRPVADNSTEEGKAQNRRIEISINLRDDTVMDLMNNYLTIEVPSSVS